VAGGGAVTRSKPDAVLPSGGKDTGAVAAGKPLVPAAEKSAVAPAPAATKPENEPWDTAWLLTYWQPLLGLLLILLLLLAVIFILMRRRDTAPLPETPFGGGLAPADQTRDGSREAAVAMDSAAQDAAPDEQGEEAPSDRGTDVSSALTEADIYLAYRRYSQAESLIRKSIERHPQSMVLKAKLLEIYAFRKDKQRFVAFMETVYETMVAVAPAIWAKVVEMGRDLVPEHRLISGSVLPEDDLDEDDLGTTAYGLIDEEDDTVILDPDLDDGEKKERGGDTRRRQPPRSLLGVDS
jgi:pilus assembly protein FimV